MITKYGTIISNLEMDNELKDLGMRFVGRCLYFDMSVARALGTKPAALLSLFEQLIDEQNINDDIYDEECVVSNDEICKEMANWSKSTVYRTKKKLLDSGILLYLGNRMYKIDYNRIEEICNGVLEEGAEEFPEFR